MVRTDPGMEGGVTVTVLPDNKSIQNSVWIALLENCTFDALSKIFAEMSSVYRDGSSVRMVSLQKYVQKLRQPSEN